MAGRPLRLKLAKAILGSRAKEFIPHSLLMACPSAQPVVSTTSSANRRSSRPTWLVLRADNANADSTSAVQLFLFRKQKKAQITGAGTERAVPPTQRRESRPDVGARCDLIGTHLKS
jgi:DNA polymerase IIIc chi subunit